MLFMPNDDALEAQARSLLEESVSAEGLTLLGYRQVPVDHAVVGRFARDTQPRIAQVFVQGKPGQTGDELERQLFLVRKRLEQAKAAAMGDAAQDFYVCTLSNRTIVYKVRVCARRRCTACTGCTCSGLWCCRGRARLDACRRDQAAPGCCRACVCALLLHVFMLLCAPAFTISYRSGPVPAVSLSAANRHVGGPTPHASLNCAGNAPLCCRGRLLQGSHKS